jgi:uroporphyrinogen-III synthase
MRPVLLVTRPEPDASRTAAHLDALGIEPIIEPMLHARAIAARVPFANGFAALAVTSANAIRFLAAYGDDFKSLPVFCVGDHTAQEARNDGFTQIHNASGTLADLAHLIAREVPTGTVFYPAAHHQSGDLAGLMRPHGIDVFTTVLYEMVPATAFAATTESALVSGEICGALFYSRRTATIFADLCTGDAFAAMRHHLECLCISENCAAPLLAQRFGRISLADDPTGKAMETLALAFAREQIKA